MIRGVSGLCPAVAPSQGVGFLCVSEPVFADDDEVLRVEQEKPERMREVWRTSYIFQSVR
jgi:hypothetical protein